MSKHKKYIGDGVYIDFDGYHLVLTAENGIAAYETIWLEPGLLEKLVAYQNRIHAIVEAELMEEE